MRLSALKQILALLHSREDSFSISLEEAGECTLNIHSLLLSVQLQLLLGTLGPEVVWPSQPASDGDGFLLLHYQVSLAVLNNTLKHVGHVYNWQMLLVKQDDIKGTDGKLQDEIQEAVHCLYQCLVAILERTRNSTCGKGISFGFRSLWMKSFS